MLRSGWLLPSPLSIPRPASHVVDDLARQYRLVGVLRPRLGMWTMLETNGGAGALQMASELLLDRVFAAVDQENPARGHAWHAKKIQHREILVHGVGHR